jgi:type I restriction enzyme S subunit
VTPPGWRECTLGDLAKETGGRIQIGPFGSQLHASDYLPHGVPVVMPVNIGDNRLVEAGVARVGPADAERLSRHRLRVGDIVYSRRGDVEKRALVREPQVDWLCGTGCLLVRVQGEEVDATYVSYWLGSPEIKAWVTQHAIGATMPNLNTGILSAVPVLVPQLAEQRSIARTLGALDDKIESNRRQSRLIDALFAAEFLALTSGCQARTMLDSVATFTKGVSYRSAELASTGDTSLVTLKSVGRHGGYQSSGLKPYVGHPKPQQVLQPRELVVAQTDLTQAADVIGRVVRVPADVSAGRLVASLDLVIVRPRERMPVEFLYGVLLEERFREHCRSRSSGTTVLHLSRDALPQYQAPAVALEDQQRFAALSRPMLDKQDALGRESTRLAALRDVLLPELLSGRIRVPEANEAVGSALA